MNKEFEKYINEQTEIFKANLINKFKEYEKEIGGNTYIPKDEEKYFFIDGSGAINSWYWSGDEEDKGGLNIGNVFKTREQAEFEVERLKMLATMKKYSKPFNPGGSNLRIVFDRYENCVKPIDNTYLDSGVLVYANSATAQKVIDEVGEERLKKYYFRSED